MLTNFSLSNFKAFGREQHLALKPITLVFGPNSSGKSSIVHALALSSELFKNGHIDVESINTEGGVVKLGGFGKYVHRRQLEAVTKLSYTFSSRYATTEYHVTLQLGRPDKSSPVFTALRYGVATEAGEIFELTHVSNEGKSILQMQNVNLTHPEIVSYIQQFIDAELLEIEDASTLVEGTVDYAASHVSFQTTEFLQHKGNHGWLDNAFNIPIMLYLLLAHTASPECQNWLFRLADMALAWENDKPKRDEVNQRIRAEAPPSSDNEEINELYKELIASIDSLNAIAPPLNEFYSAISYVTENYRNKMDLFQPTFDMDSGETNAFYAAIDRHELEMLHNRANQIFRGVVDSLRSLAVTVNKRLSSVKEPPQLEGNEDNIFYPGVKLEADRILKSDELLDEPGLASFTYLGPMRELPPRTIQFNRPDELPKSERLWNLLQTDRMNRVNEWLGASYLNTNYRISSRPLMTFTPDELLRFIEKLSEDGNVSASDLPPSLSYELVLTDLLTNTEVDFESVGYGIGQVLPVLLACFETSNKLIAIEQPEIHLHPALQAELGDAFIESALGEPSNRFVLETHSEHLILRLMRRMRETADGSLPQGLSEVTPDDISILFVEPSSKGSVVREIRLDEEGELIDAWPGGFFEEGFRERFA